MIAYFSFHFPFSFCVLVVKHYLLHCRVITSYRTFFMYASSAEDAEEWIELLREKMSKVSSEEMWRWECEKGAGGECVSVSVSV